MNSITKSPIMYKKAIAGAKIIACVFIIAWMMSNLFIDGMDNYINYEDYLYQNESEDGFPAVGTGCIEQTFYAQSSKLSNMTLYLGELSDNEVIIQILDDSRKILAQEIINLRDFKTYEWNIISIDCNNLKKNGQYTILLKGEELSGIILDASNTYPEIFTNCTVDGIEVEDTLAVGLQFTERYVLLGNGLEFAVNVLYILIIAFALCFTVIHFEDILDVFKKSEKKKGFFYAIYFSVYTVLFFNPLDPVRNEITEFKRIIGIGLLKEGIDVSKRISNFNHWFICFAIGFFSFFILANYFKNKELTGENKKAMDLLDNVIVIGNVILALRCITYFYDESQNTVFYYSGYFINLIVFLLIGYMFLDLRSRINLGEMEALLLSGWSLALPAAVIITHDWTDGRVLMGLQVFLSALIVSGVKFLKIDWDKAWISGGLNICTVFLSLIPFCTSFYIEFIILLNQHEIFWTHLKKIYFGAVVFSILIMAAFAFVLIKKGKGIENWKRVSYPALVLGFSCLYAQIPISSVYNAHIYETANFSVLISDFLHYGEIPIVQHYGGHMMRKVGTGILYALLNNDNTGALFSPYGSYPVVVIAILFYILVKLVWDEDAAVLTVLLFPFYSSVASWGWGILMTLTVMAYVKKNTYLRAMLFWLSFVWCTLARLDLGFSFGLACLAAFIIYIIADKNRLAIKQLTITLAVWGITGGALWFGICIMKGIHPLNRLLEFLMISLSNQNWAFAGIGDMTQAAFAWAYLFLPFLVMVCMLYSVFSEKIRKNLGTGVWMINLVFGFAFFFNFSRGLVRHSLEEKTLALTWSAYVFLAVFIVAAVNQRKAFLPTYTVLILLESLLLSGDSYSKRAIVDVAAEKIGSYTETWTYSHGHFTEEDESELFWPEIQKNRQVINRVEWDENLVKIVDDYGILINALLEDDETYVDCCRTTTLYSLLGRRDPVYVSQSPLQLSGQFTQEEFVKEIRDVPIVLMPYGQDKLDNISNSYKYYKVFEYVYMNYVPLCTYEDIYAVWCLPERYDDMASKVRNLRGESRCINGSVLSSADLTAHSGELVENSDGSVQMNAIEDVCEISELQNLFDLTPYIDKDMAVAVEYEADDSTDIKLFYTTNPEDDYTEDKVSVYSLTQKSGTAYFEIPVTQYTRLKLSIPPGSRVKIKSFTVSLCNCRFLAYEHDRTYRSEDVGQYDNDLTSAPEFYKLDKLPVIWAEKDRQNSADNNVLTILEYENGVYRYDLSPTDYGTDGNYLKVSMNFTGWDHAEKTGTDDEITMAEIRIGNMVDGQFETKYSYSFVVEEGYHDYMFRISNDYYWYLGETNAVILESDSPLYNIKMAVLEGD